MHTISSIHTTRSEKGTARAASFAVRRAFVSALGLAAAICVAVGPRPMAAEMPSPQPAVGAAVNAYAPNADVYASYQGDGQIHPWHIQGQIWLMAGEPGGSNVAVQIGDEGVLVVDTGTQAMAPKLLTQIQQLAQEHEGDLKGIQFVINTNMLPDHIGGNEVIRRAGNAVEAGNEVTDGLGLVAGAKVIANQNVLNRLVAESTTGTGRPHSSQPLWPSDTLDFDLYDTYFNGEAAQMYHPHNANTDGQLMVLFRRSDVIAAGDVLDMNSYPVIDVARSGTIDGELVALNKLIELTVPAENQEGGTVVIPGHGRLGDQSDVVRYRNMVTIIRNRVQFYKNQGKTLQQVLSLKPTVDYDDRWGATTASWTTRDFITAVYDTLPQKGPVFSMLNTTLVPAPAEVLDFKIPGVKIY